MCTIVKLLGAAKCPPQDWIGVESRSELGCQILPKTLRKIDLHWATFTSFTTCEHVGLIANDEFLKCSYCCTVLNMAFSLHLGSSHKWQCVHNLLFEAYILAVKPEITNSSLIVLWKKHGNFCIYLRERENLVTIWHFIHRITALYSSTASILNH